MMFEREQESEKLLAFVRVRVVGDVRCGNLIEGVAVDLTPRAEGGTPARQPSQFAIWWWVHGVPPVGPPPSLPDSHLISIGQLWS